MKFSRLLAGTALVLLPLATPLAQTTGTSKARPGAPVNTQAAGRKAAAVKPAKAAEPLPPVDEPLSDAQLALAEKIHTGLIACELGASVTVTADDKKPGFFHVSSGKQSYHMHPVESRTGAVRMEDTRAGAMWLQLGNKSMLMNQKAGQRVADECATPVQREFAAQLLLAPPATLFDEPKR